MQFTRKRLIAATVALAALVPATADAASNQSLSKREAYRQVTRVVKNHTADYYEVYGPAACTRKRRNVVECAFDQSTTSNDDGIYCDGWVRIKETPRSYIWSEPFSSCL